METLFIPAQALHMWKTQVEAGFRFVEALTEGAIRMHEMQLAAASETHAAAEATRRSIDAAADPAGIARIGAEWLQRNNERAGAYLRALSETALETNARLLECFRGRGE